MQNHDSSPLPNVDVWMVNNDLSQIPRFHFPDGFQTRFFRDDRDIDLWVKIQQESDTLFQATHETFARSVPGTLAYRAERVMFVETAEGEAVGTIIAWNGDYFSSLSGQPDNGHIHWVAILPAFQGRGLSVPMLAICCQELEKRGYPTAWLSTNTQRLPALNLYLKLGFQPAPRDQKERDAWQAIKSKLKYPLD